MREQKFGVRRRIAIFNVRRCLIFCKNIRQGFAPNDAAFSQRALAAGRQFFRAPDFRSELPNLPIAPGKIFPAGRPQWRLARHRGPGFDKVAEFAEQPRAHGRQLGQDQHAIAHAMGQHQSPIFHGEAFLDHFGVDVIEVATGRQFRIANTGHFGRILANEIGRVGHAPALLQHPAAAALIVNPRPAALLEPGVVPVELRAPRRVDAGIFGVVRLLNADVEHHVIDAFAERPVAPRL